MKIIDLRSDTITLPTEDMRRAMYEAELGDDVYKEDPTVNFLEELAADMLGKEAALLTASGTMSNLIAVLTHTHHGNEILLGSEAHILWYELGSASALGGVVLRTVPDNPNGQMDLDEVQQTIRPANIHFPQTALLCLENTHNRCGGTVLTPEYTSAMAKLAHQHGLQVHLDGARIFNAAVALGVPASRLVTPVDSICFCLSKSLSAPVGSLLCGTEEFVAKARRWRQMLGGGMRQAGIIAAAGIIALQRMINRLDEDHSNAKRIACGLAGIPGIAIHSERVQSNIVIFEPPNTVSALEFIKEMDARGVRFSYLGGRKVRAVTHCMVNTGDMNEALKRIETLIKEMGVKTG
ncbi:MAG: low-specificity L-threonine aldolase [Chloroflexota bacterium]|nr:low-specificity L-threonine aldolase [Chloroflexota bacterium]